MLGGIILVVALIAMVPMVLLTGMAAAAVIGHVSTKDAEARHEGSELIALNQ